MQPTETNAIELSAAASPRPQLLISVGNDKTRNFPEFGFPFIKQVYERHDCGERVENVHFAAEGHDFGPSKRHEVYRFFARHLELEPLEEALQEIEIEAHEQMAVFDKNHPLPEHAAKGSEQINEAFARLCDVPAAV